MGKFTLGQWTGVAVGLLGLSVTVVGCGGSLVHEATLTIANQSDFTICDVYLSAPRSSTWGGDWLEEEESIPPEELRTFEVAAGHWNVRMDDCAGQPLYARRGVAIEGARRIDFLPAAVDRQRQFGLRRFASRSARRF